VFDRILRRLCRVAGHRRCAGVFRDALATVELGGTRSPYSGGVSYRWRFSRYRNRSFAELLDLVPLCGCGSKAQYAILDELGHFMDFSDLTLVLFVFIVLWIALNLSGGTGGGLRARVPSRN
jgi:hypothetical protein